MKRNCWGRKMRKQKKEKKIDDDERKNGTKFRHFLFRSSKISIPRFETISFPFKRRKVGWREYNSKLHVTLFLSTFLVGLGSISSQSVLELLEQEAVVNSNGRKRSWSSHNRFLRAILRRINTPLYQLYNTEGSNQHPKHQYLSQNESLRVSPITIFGLANNNIALELPWMEWNEMREKKLYYSPSVLAFRSNQVVAFTLKGTSVLYIDI